MQTIDVHTSQRAYTITVAKDCLWAVGSIANKLISGRNAFIISDTNVYPLWGKPVEASLRDAGFTVSSNVFLAGEASKNLTTLSNILEAMANVPLNRDDVVIALGGGVVGDVAGFAAATYMRGIQVIQVPTSLLAMVDSSIGGKTAVDLHGGKNLAGAFWQPSAVIASLTCLSTIEPDLFTDSCGEAIKHGILADPAMFANLETLPLNTRDEEGGLDYERLERIVARNIEIKRNVVDQDEQEHGLRQTLNLGHTIGHAIEAANNYQLGHGSSVAAGMCFIARAAAKLDKLAPKQAERIIDCIKAHGLPTTSDFSTDELLHFALADKKRHGSSINVIMLYDIGHVDIEPMDIEAFRDLIELGR